MATGWAHEGAVLDQIRDTITDGVQSARARLPQGPSAVGCVECGDEIPQKRRDALPGVNTCIACQTGRDACVVHTMINRRGSKDSQLK
jgi:phage/conjugal plasmid C-4 type zinc finger TraR family protein